MRVRGPGATGSIVWALAALGSGTACTLDRSAADGHFRCDAQRGCPEGRVCSADGFCELVLADAAQMVPDAGPAGAACGTMGLLRDDFTSLTLDRQKWLDLYASSYELDDGRLVFRPPNTTISSTIASLYIYDWRDSSLSARVFLAPEGTVPATAAGLYVGAYDLTVRMRASSGSDELVMEIADAESDILFAETAAYSPDDDAYWRVRHQDGEVLWETSPDGLDWTEQASADFDERGRPARAFLWMIAQESPDDGDPAEIGFDDVNLEAPEVDGFCPVDTLTENFDADELDVLDWEVDPCASLVDGRLHFEDVDPFCRIETRLAYDLTDGEIAFEVPEPGPGDPTVMVDLLYAFDQRLRIHMTEPGVPDRTITLQRVVDGEPEDLDSFELDPEAHRWWGFRHQSGSPAKLYFRFSPDGQEWTESEISPAPDVSSVRLEMAVAKEEVGTGAGPVELDNLNLPP